MKNLWIALFLIVTAIVSSSILTYAEMANEGSGEIRTGKSGTFEILKLGESRLQMNWNEKGVVVEAPENSPFTHASYHTIGTLHSIEGKYKSSGGIVFTRPNGDQVFGAMHEIPGLLGVGPNGGSIELIGGTGECANIKGQIDMMPRPKIKSSKAGTYQGIGIAKATWTIP